MPSSETGCSSWAGALPVTHSDAVTGAVPILDLTLSSESSPPEMSLGGLPAAQPTRCPFRDLGMHRVPSVSLGPCQPTGGARFLGLSGSLLLLRGPAVVWSLAQLFSLQALAGRSFPLGRW